MLNTNTLERIMEIGENKTQLLFSTNGQVIKTGNVNANVCIDQLIILVSMSLMYKDTNIEDLTNLATKPNDIIELVNSVNGYSPNGKFHRLMNLVSELVGREVSVNPDMYYMYQQQYTKSDEKINAYLRSMSINVSVEELLILVSKILTDKAYLDQEHVNMFLSKLGTKVSIEDKDYYLYKQANGFSILFNDQDDYCLIYQPLVSCDGSLLKADEEVINIILNQG